MGLRRRLQKLEGSAGPEEQLPDWPLEEQAQDVMDSLEIHRMGGTKQLATDREINVLGILYAAGELPGGMGEYRFRSGVVVTLTDNGSDTPSASLSGDVSLEDLPDEVGRHFERMDPDKQPERERWLHKTWRQRKERRAETERFIEAGEEADRRWKLRLENQEEGSS